MVQISDPSVQQLLAGRYIASLGTENSDGSIHLVAVWFYHDGQHIYVATSSRTRKAQNVSKNSKVSLMIDSRNPATQKGICIKGTARVLEGDASKASRDEVHRKYLSQAALADPRVGPVFAAFDDVSIQIAPTSVILWDMNEMDRQAFGGAFASNPGYFLPVND
jgi:general stress protein 26